ncbi:MAG: hypothetical protein LBQ80_03415 [Clostridium sp.]|nr:hypothetical protein [Clostridium sp.]
MGKYFVVRGRGAGQPPEEIYGVGIQGEQAPLIADYSTLERTEALVRLLNAGGVSKTHFWDVAEDFLV